jgi:hypothetical protein
MDLINLAQDREIWQAIVNAVLNIRFPLNVGNFLTSRGAVSFSGTTLLHEVSLV